MRVGPKTGVGYHSALWFAHTHAPEHGGVKVARNHPATGRVAATCQVRGRRPGGGRTCPGQTRTMAAVAVSRRLVMGIST